MAYRWGEHVGELELRVSAESEAGILRDAARAFGELLVEEGGEAIVDPGSRTETRDVRAHGTDRALVLAAFLDELIFLAEVEGFVPEAVDDVVVTGEGASACVAGRIGSPPHLVKAVTHHALRFEPADGGGWEASAVLDV